MLNREKQLQMGENLNYLICDLRVNHYSVGINFSRQNLTSVDVRL